MNVSVVIPFKDNINSIIRLLNDLDSQDYPGSLFEIILVNDYSEDSPDRIKDALRNYSIEVRLLSNPRSPGKKHALYYGVRQAKYDFIMITDADCRTGKSWIHYFMDHKLRYPETKLISSGVIMEPEKGFFQAFQALDFSSLVATGAASFLGNRPIMCNGANLGFDRGLFLESFDFLHPAVNSGDDIFLMLYTHKKYPGTLSFIKNRKAFTKTTTEESFLSYFRQRKRWGSKAKFYRDPLLVTLSLTVLAVHLMVPLLFIMWFVNPVYPVLAGILLMVKSIFDYVFLRSFLYYSRQDFLLKFFLPSQLINTIMIPVIAFAGIISGPEKKKFPDEKT